MDNNNPHRPRDPRGFSRTPLKHNASNDEQERGGERGYAGYNSHGHRHNRNSITSPATGSNFSYSALGEGNRGGGNSTNFGHYGQRRTEGYNRRPTGPGGGTWDTPSKEQHHQREREKEREMMSIYGRGGEDEEAKKPAKKYHNPCRFSGHDHEWRDCPNNYRNKNKRPGSFNMGNKFHGGKDGPEIGGGIGKSTSWGAIGADYYGPASESSAVNTNKNSDWHGDSSARGYKSNEKTHDLPQIGSRSKSFGAESSRGSIADRVDRGFEIDNESTTGTVDSDHSPRNNPASGDRKWNQYNNRQDRSNYYSPPAVSKPRASPTASSAPNQHERGYSSTSFTPLSTGPRRGSVQLNPNIPVPPFNSSQSYDSGSVRDSKIQGEEVAGDSSLYRKLATESSSPMRSHDTIDSDSNLQQQQQQQQSLGSGSMSPPRCQMIHRLNSNASSQEQTSVNDTPSMARSGSKVHEPVDTAPPTPSSPTKQPVVAKENPAPTPSLTCAELGAPEKVSKAEGIVSKMNALMNKPTDAIESDSSGGSAVRLPSKNEILKCMAVIDGKIKIKDDDALALKKQIKEIEQEKLAEVERLLKQEEEKRQNLIDGVASRKTEREVHIQTKEDGLARAIGVQKASIEEGMASELLQFQNDCSEALVTNVAKLNSEISLIQTQLEEAEMVIEEIDTPLISNEEADDSAIDESYFVPTLDAPGKMASLISSVLADNQRIAAEAHHESLAAIPYFPLSEAELAVSRDSPKSVITNEEWSNRARKVTGLDNALYTDPSDVPMFKENNESFLEMGPQIKELIQAQNKKLKKRWEDLASQYLVRQMVFNEETGVNTDTSERGGFFSITGRADENGEIQPLGNVRGNNPYRRPRRGVSPGDVVRSEYEQEQIIAEIAAKEAMEKRIKEGGCALHHQRGMLENSMFASFSNGLLGNRVDDFMEDEIERKHINIWTDMEKCIFFDRFLHHPKDFRKISSFLRNKTTKDCIAFYYNSKKTIPYKHALKEFIQRKKRHGSVIAWDATIQAALSVGATIKAGESPEKPLRFELPQSDYTFRTHRFHPMQMELFNNLETVALNSKHHGSSHRPKRSNWFILDASSRKYIKHHKDDKDHVSKRKSEALSDDGEEGPAGEAETGKVQRTTEMVDVHEEKKSAKANKWKADEKKLFFEAVEMFGHNWAKVSEHVGTRTTTQVKNFFYDNKKQTSKKKEKASKLAEGGLKAKATTERKDVDQDKSSVEDNNRTNPSVQEVIELIITPNPEAKMNAEVGMCMPVNQSENITSAEAQYQQLLLEQQNRRFIQQQHQMQLQQQHDLMQERMQERLIHEQMQRMHEAQRLQEAQRMEDARQAAAQQEMMRHQQQQQWLAQYQQHQQNQQQVQGQDWVDQQQLHNIQQLLAHRQQEQSPMNQNSYSLQQYQGNSNNQSSEMERLFQMQAMAALARQGNDNPTQQQQIELFLQQQRQQQQQGPGNNGYPHFHQMN